MIRHSAVALLAAVLAMTSAAAPASEDRTKAPYVREQRNLKVQGTRETWQLEWDGQPKEVCGPQEVFAAITCPCAGLSYGEYGILSLVRLRGGQEIDRLDLRPFFGQFDYPDAELLEGQAYVQRWPMQTGDFDREDNQDPNLVAEIRRRPPVLVMKPADYNRDGKATEFLLQVGTLPCGHTQFIALGVTPGEPRLHALASAGRPGHPLFMPLDAWKALLRTPEASTITTLTCGDHGSDEQDDLIVQASDGEIRVRQRTYACARAGGKGKLLSDKDY